MNLSLILLLKLFLPMEVVIPNTIGDVVNLGGDFRTYKVIDRTSDSILLVSIDLNENRTVKDSIVICEDLLNLKIYHDPPFTSTSTDDNGLSLGLDTTITQNGDTLVLPKRRMNIKDDNFRNIVDTICFLIPPSKSRLQYPTNSVFGIFDNKVYVLSYSYPDSAKDLCYKVNRKFYSYDHLKEVIERMMSYRDMNLNYKQNIDINTIHDDFVNYFETDHFSFKEFSSIGTELLFVTKNFIRVQKMKLKDRLSGFYELDEFASKNYPRYFRSRHMRTMSLGNDEEFKKAVFLVTKDKYKHRQNAKLINQFILKFLDKRKSNFHTRKSVDKLLSNRDVNKILYERDRRLILYWLEK